MANVHDLAKRLRDGETLYSAWCGFPDPLVTEAVARSGFDLVALDMQHAFHTEASLPGSIAGAAAADVAALVRIPLGRFDVASRALDFGAAGVIAPMINTIADARSFGAAMKYPPVGARSWGPGRAMALRGMTNPQRYLSSANQQTLALAMIETRAALAIAGEIAAIEGIDGLFVGPSDFSIAWSNGSEINPHREDMLQGMSEVVSAARAAGKIAAIYAAEPGLAQLFTGMGFTLIAMGTESGYLSAGVTSLLALAKAPSRPS